MENAAGGFDPNLQAMSSSKLGFEWSFGNGAKQDREVVLVRCDNVVQQGVPAPVAFGKIQPRAVDLQKTDFEKFAAAAVVLEKCQVFRSSMGLMDGEVHKHVRRVHLMARGPRIEFFAYSTSTFGGPIAFLLLGIPEPH